MKVYSLQSVEIWLDQGYVFKSHRCSKYQSVRVLEQNQLFQQHFFCFGLLVFWLCLEMLLSIWHMVSSFHSL